MKENNQCLTLADHAKRLGQDGNVDEVVELLSKTNPILTDMVFKEGNLPTGHRDTIRTTEKTEIQDAIFGRFEVCADICKGGADLNGNVASFRLSEDMASLEAMSQEMAQTLFYGNPGKNPNQFLGLTPRYNDLSATNAQNIIDAGGRSTNNTSIWLVCWGDQTTFGTFPKGSKAGLIHRDLGEVTLTDNDGGKYQGYRTHYQWKNGLVVKDWHYVSRMANIDTAKLDSGMADPIDIIKLMIKSLHRIPNLSMARPAFYCNRTISEYLDIQSLEKSSLALKVKETEGEFWNTFRNIPIRQCDAIINGEEAAI